MDETTTRNSVDYMLSNTIMVHYPILQEHYIELKQAIEKEIRKARIDETSDFVNVDTVPGPPISICSTCEGIYDYARERLDQLNSEEEIKDGTST
jgi:hypothetical protein